MSTSELHSFKTNDGTIFTRTSDEGYYNVVLPKRSGDKTTSERKYPYPRQVITSTGGHRFVVDKTSFGIPPVPRDGWVKLKPRD